MKEMAKKIIDFSPHEEGASEVQFSLPPHVKNIEELSDGGIRWNFAQWRMMEYAKQVILMSKACKRFHGR